MHISDLNIAQAKLPTNYVAALEALRLCAKDFTPEAYWEATAALALCAEMDECETWPQTPEILASYARVADDEELVRLVYKVEKARHAWKISQGVESVPPRRPRQSRRPLLSRTPADLARSEAAKAYRLYRKQEGARHGHE